MSTLETVLYYAKLLIIQYIGKPKAFETIRTVVSPIVMAQTSIQEISLSDIPTSGAFTLAYGDTVSGSIAWDAEALDIQTALRTIEGLEDVTVLGDVEDGTFFVTFVGVLGVANLLTVSTNTLGVSISIEETDLTLPLAVLNAFNMSGEYQARGVNLDVLAKYIGVSRTAIGEDGSLISLDDDQLFILIQMGIIRNSGSSSLFAIQGFLFQFFGSEIRVIDFTTMFMTYEVSTELFESELFQMFLIQNLLPKPMAVGLGIVAFDDGYFGMIELDFPPDPDGLLGFSEAITAQALELSNDEELELSNDEILYVNNPDIILAIEGGGIFTELYGV